MCGLRCGNSDVDPLYVTEKNGVDCVVWVWQEDVQDAVMLVSSIFISVCGLE